MIYLIILLLIMLVYIVSLKVTIGKKEANEKFMESLFYNEVENRFLLKVDKTLNFEKNVKMFMDLVDNFNGDIFKACGEIIPSKNSFSSENKFVFLLKKIKEISKMNVEQNGFYSHLLNKIEKGEKLDVGVINKIYDKENQKCFNGINSLMFNLSNEIRKNNTDCNVIGLWENALKYIENSRWEKSESYKFLKELDKTLKKSEFGSFSNVSFDYKLNDLELDIQKSVLNISDSLKEIKKYLEVVLIDNYNSSINVDFKGEFYEIKILSEKISSYKKKQNFEREKIVAFKSVKAEGRVNVSDYSNYESSNFGKY